ncbi:receptor-like protein 47 [Quercus suber]|uniref:Receptor-like protein 47 n=1 Tax=Quercus suber TaxID=58331 RepID=A0AAW0MCK8_QUESU
MASSSYCLKFVYLLSFLSTIHFVAVPSFSFVQTLCHSHERSYLLQFKESFAIINNNNDNTTLQKFQNLGLGSCNLSKFPDYLANQDELKWLHLGTNNIHGQVPEWFWNVSKENLEVIDLSENFLTSLGQYPITSVTSM